MPIPAGSTVEILPFTARGCLNNVGLVAEACEKWICIDDTTGQMGPVWEYLVRYMVENCGQCLDDCKTYCEFQLAVIPNPQPITDIKSSKKLSDIARGIAK